MISIGSRVTVKHVNREDPPVSDRERRKKKGAVTYLNALGKTGIVTTIHGGTAGVGDSPEDPFYVVRFPGGSSDGFWTEELEVNP